MKSYFVYILECSDGTLYTGITTDPERRLKEHNTSSVGARYTQGRRPVRLMYTKEYGNRTEASKEEARIKKLNREQKFLFMQTQKI